MFTGNNFNSLALLPAKNSSNKCWLLRCMVRNDGYFTRLADKCNSNVMLDVGIQERDYRARQGWIDHLVYFSRIRLSTTNSRHNYDSVYFFIFFWELVMRHKLQVCYNSHAKTSQMHLLGAGPQLAKFPSIEAFTRHMFQMVHERVQPRLIPACAIDKAMASVIKKRTAV